MKVNKIIGVLLIILALSVIVGLAFESMIYWYIVDTAFILIGLIGGIILLKQK